MQSSNDTGLLSAKLYTAVVSDSLDQLSVRHQAMREYLRPLYSPCKVAGWARIMFPMTPTGSRSKR